MSDLRRTHDPLLLLLGAIVAATGIVLVVRAGLGLGPWTALAAGLAGAAGTSVAVGVAIVAAAWMALGGDGESRATPIQATAAALAVVATEVGLRIVPEPGARAIELRCALLVVGVVAIALAKAMTDVPLATAQAQAGAVPSAFESWTGITTPAGTVALAALALLAGGMLGAVVNLGSVLAVLVVPGLSRRLAPRFAARVGRAGAATQGQPRAVGSLGWASSDASSPWSPSSPASPASAAARPAPRA